jgi:hypothetical protein
MRLLAGGRPAVCIGARPAAILRSDDRAYAAWSYRTAKRHRARRPDHGATTGEAVVQPGTFISKRQVVRPARSRPTTPRAIKPETAFACRPQHPLHLLQHYRLQSRLNLLRLLRAGRADSIINAEPLAHMRERALAADVITRLAEHSTGACERPRTRTSACWRTNARLKQSLSRHPTAWLLRAPSTVLCSARLSRPGCWRTFQRALPHGKVSRSRSSASSSTACFVRTLSG